MKLDRWFRRRRLKKHQLKTLSQFERPARNWEFMAHATSPWAVIAQWVYDILLLVLIMIIFGTLNQFSDFIAGRGDYRDRIDNEQRSAVCLLISKLQADTTGQLEALAEELQCATGPMPLGEGAPASPTEVPIDPGAAASNSGSDVDTGTATEGGGVTVGGRTTQAPTPRPTAAPGATNVPVPPGTPQQGSTAPPAPVVPGTGGASPTPTPPASIPTAPPAGGGDQPLVTLCLPLTNVCVAI